MAETVIETLHRDLVSVARARFGGERAEDLEPVLLEVAGDISALREFTLEEDDPI